VTGSKADVIDLRQQMGAAVLEGQRSSELVAELEAQLEKQAARAAALQAQLVEVEVVGAGKGDRYLEGVAKTQQLADQLHATQRTAAELSDKLEKTQLAVGDSMAQRQLVELRLKTAEEKVAKVLAAKDRSEIASKLAVREKTETIGQLHGQIDALKIAAEDLKYQLAELENKLRMEKAGSLAAAKKSALAMLESYDVSQMMQSAEDGASMAEAMAVAGAGAGAGAVGAGAGAGAAAAGVKEGEWLQAYDAGREFHYWYNNVTMEVLWELPEGARVHQSVSNHGAKELPKHFEGPSGLNSR
jgi:chromosome segregation ATPase